MFWDRNRLSLRYFNVFGPRQDPTSQYSGVLSLFIKAILERRAPTIFGDGGTSRDFTYVDDVVGLEYSRQPRLRPAFPDNVFNGGNGGRITLNQWALGFATEVRRRLNSRELWTTATPGDVRDSQADTTRAGAGTGPRTSR